MNSKYKESDRVQLFYNYFNFKCASIFINNDMIEKANKIS